MVREEVVVDTNVPAVANFKSEQADSNCEAACVKALKMIKAERRMLLDDKGLIIEEYRRNLSASGQPGLGDAFFKWLFDNQFNPKHCRIVPLAFHDDRGFVEFPDDPRLAKFHDDDRKFVAVALASGNSPELLYAVERGWRRHRQALAENGVNVVCLCPKLGERE